MRKTWAAEVACAEHRRSRPTGRNRKPPSALLGYAWAYRRRVSAPAPRGRVLYVRALKKSRPSASSISPIRIATPLPAKFATPTTTDKWLPPEKFAIATTATSIAIHNSRRERHIVNGINFRRQRKRVVMAAHPGKHVTQRQAQSAVPTTPINNPAR